ncbi:MAG: pyridoxamine 5'-phosphate oxidase [Acidimicrobiia bacterium]|nr:pyridoxamine 5'-phosphate oxidase family protein [Acidimicrobiia bacterium]NNF65112.1 pyridoxamine 5'-phosphate oxidase [Acidimicrobiia bacterium]
MSPLRDRPAIPASYGIETSEEGMLSWEQVRAAIDGTKTYWISTVRADGEPHLIPNWGGWDGSKLHIEGGDDTLWARNLAHNGAVRVGADNDSIQVIIHGTALNGHAEAFDVVAANYASKYPYTPADPDFWIITPTKVLAWDISEFAKSPTRFRFEEAS